MAKLIPMDQAAAMLGITVEQLTELRSNNEIFGYRDGANWKFKQGEIERYAADADIRLPGASAAPLSDVDEDDFELSDGSGFLEVDSDEVVIGGSSDGDLFEESSSEIANPKIMEEDSSIEISQVRDDSSGDEMILEDDSDEIFGGLNLEESGDEIRLDDNDDVLASDEAVTDEKELAFGSSSLTLAGSSKKLLSGDSANVLDDDEPIGESASDTGKLLGGSDLEISEEDLFSDDLELADSGSFDDSAELDSDFEDSDLVLEDSDSSTEIVLEANEGGISLSANESGISLEEEPLELGGSDIDSLELPEDDDMIVLEEAADADSATVMQEDDFNLTPLEESLDDESSGSQVIALEDSDIYTDESEAAILTDSADLMAQPAMLDDTSGYGAPMAPGADMGMGYSQTPMIAPGGAPALPEAPYSVWQILSLALVLLLLLTGGVIIYDVARNMWMPEDRVISKSLLNVFLELVGMNKMQ